MPWTPGDRIDWEELSEARRVFIRNPYALTMSQLSPAAKCFDMLLPSIPEAMEDLCVRQAKDGDARKMALAAAHHGARRAAWEVETDAKALRKILAVLEPAVEHCRVFGLRLTVGELRSVAWALHRFYVAEAHLIGSSAPMQRLRETLWTASFGPNLYLTLERQHAIRRQNILLVGEPGTGKELVANVLRAAVVTNGEDAPPSQAINCAAIPHQLAESELFGVEKGAHSTADVRRRGKIAAASGGTLFLDEVADLPLTVQATLLSVVSNGKLTPLGGNDTLMVDVRYISATSRPIFAMVDEKTFRDDLFGRIGATTIDVPSLRDRPEDIAEIARSLLTKLAPPDENPESASSQIASVDKDFEVWLRDEASRLPWLGNVRELEAAVRAHVIGFRNPTQTRRSAAPPPLSGARGDDDSLNALPTNILDCTATDAEASAWYLQRVLNHTKGNLPEAARILRIDRGTLRRRMAKLEGKTETDGDDE